ncbi:hypothetical protein C8R44DRAFT_739521 [Mycena epipterygia]|nr:hypothetical protein C8R44DRAFT_739521 [Mycena epipterygia]
MLSSSNFLLGFTLGVVWAVGCFVVQDLDAVKHGIASFVAFPPISTSTLLIIVNLAVLDMVLIFPRLRSLVCLVKKKHLHISPRVFKTSVRPAYPLGSSTSPSVQDALSCRGCRHPFHPGSYSVVGAFHPEPWHPLHRRVIRLFILAHEKTVPFITLRKFLHISLPAFKTSVRRAYPTSVLNFTAVLFMALYHAAVIITSILGLIRSLAHFIWNHGIPFIVGVVRLLIPARDKIVFYGDSSMVESEDEWDTILVNESGPSSISKNIVGSPVLPPSPTIDVPTKDTASLESSTSAAEVVPAPVSLNPSVPAFGSTVKHQVPSIVTRSNKQD